MTSSVPREWLGFEYLDPKKLLVQLREAELTLPLHELPPAAASLRTRTLRRFHEGRQAALFCYGMGRALGHDVSFAQVEARDYDIVCRFAANDATHYVPVQLKEWVPDTIPNAQPLQVEIDKLAKYVDSSDLAVAFHLNRRARVEFSEITAPKGKIAELWFYGALDPNQEQWFLLGNAMSEHARRYEFAYPTEA